MQTKPIAFAFFLFVTFFTLNKGVAQTVNMVGPAGSVAYGTNVTVLTNGNYVITDPYYSEGGVDSIGAVYLYNGSTNALISTLKGSSKNDWVGSNGVYVLDNGNYVVSSYYWNNSNVNGVGAATWCNGNTGLNGIVSSGNSLIGSTTNDHIGSVIYKLANGNYVVISVNWNNNTVQKVGAATWCNGATGLTGTVSKTNSLVGSATNDFSSNYVTTLINGNYIVGNPNWDNNTLTDAGAATWCNGAIGLVGTISSGNSLIGSSSFDNVGLQIISLSNGNYVVKSEFSNGTYQVGAATWGDGTKGINGTINSNNSLIGTYKYDIGFPIALESGNYVVIGDYNTLGSVTWGNGNMGISGYINSNNSLVGGTMGDYIGEIGGVKPLHNGNYIVNSSSWGGNRGAVTLCKADGSTIGTITSSNSLIGTNSGDLLGHGLGFSGVTALSNNNYVINSPLWNGSIGAVTFCKADGTTVGTINSNNSLIGNTFGDSVGCGGTIALNNGNYVIDSYKWGNKKGAVTWGNGTTGVTGTIKSTNSLIGTSKGDMIGAGYYDSYLAGFWGVIPLNNSNYIVESPSWNNNIGASTWGNGSIGTSGTINSGNSLINISTSNNISDIYQMGTALNNSPNYIIQGFDKNGYALTVWGNGAGGTVGDPNICNTVVSAIPYGPNNTINFQYGGNSMRYVFDSAYNFLLINRPLDKIVSRYYLALGAAIPSNNDNSSTTISGNSPFIFPTTTGCGQIAALTPSGTSPVSGSVTAKTWLESPQPTYFAARHYEITPATNPTTSTGTITLYFTQADFDGFNNQNPALASLLPNGPNDAVGKSHLLVQKEGGVSNVGTGLPGTYPGTVTTINPADSNIVWNTALQRWEITFDVIGFSGFFIKTAATAIVLPLQLLNFSGNRQGNNNLLQWATSNEVGTKTFVLESSANGNSFAPIGNVAATGGGQYVYTDVNPVANRTYYRLKMVDVDGKFTYSNIIWISTTGSNNISVYPNPVSQTTTLNISNNNQLIGTKAQLTDVGGRLLQQITINHSQEQLNMMALPAGLYLLKLNDGTVVKMMKQ